jgi:hypothetical protein
METQFRLVYFALKAMKKSLVGLRGHEFDYGGNEASKENED